MTIFWREKNMKMFVANTYKFITRLLSWRRLDQNTSLHNKTVMTFHESVVTQCAGRVMRSLVADSANYGGTYICQQCSLSSAVDFSWNVLVWKRILKPVICIFSMVDDMMLRLGCENAVFLAENYVCQFSFVWVWNGYFDVIKQISSVLKQNVQENVWT